MTHSSASQPSTSSLHRFLIIFCTVDLRPVEEFRNTPIIPISEKELFKYKQDVEAKNRKGYYVEIRKDTIYFYTIATLTLGMLFYAFLMVNEKQMRIKE